MTTTDTDALIERLARAMHAGEVTAGFAADAWDGMSADSRAWYRANAAAVLPIIAEEVRKAKAEAWNDGWEHRDTPDGYAWDGEQDVPLTSSPYDNPYRTAETGDNNEHR